MRMAMRRREWLATTALAGAWSALSWPGLAQQFELAPGGGQPIDLVPREPFFNDEERAFVEIAVRHLVPADELTPDGVDLGIVEFIDRQLGGPFGRAARWYMEGPFIDGYEEQGYQIPFTPAELYRHSIPRVNQWVQDRYTSVLADLAPAEQIDVLRALEAGEVPLEIDDPKAFFELLLQNAKEGFFADPMYGGNRNFASWEMIGFPGARYDYSPFIASHGRTFPLPPVGVMGRDGRPLWEILG